MYWAQQEFLPIAIEAPADRKTRDTWLDRLWQAIEDDGVDYLSPIEDRWGELCRSLKVPHIGPTYSSACFGLPGLIRGPGITSAEAASASPVCWRQAVIGNCLRF